MSDAGRMYIARKCGKGMGLGYLLSSLTPLLLLLAVTAALSFSISFIVSLSSRIDRMMQVMGSGSVRTLQLPPSDALPEGSETASVRNGSGLIYSEHGESAVILKGIGGDYFSGMRGREIGIGGIMEGTLNPTVVSSSLAASLSLSDGDRFTLLMWEESRGRARPVLCTVAAIFPSVYPQLDSHLAYIPLSLLDSQLSYEILLPEGTDPDRVVEDLWHSGIRAESYRSMHSSLYGNVKSSIAILYPILAAIAVLAAFFSSDAVQVYISRDMEDIRAMLILGMQPRALRRAYMLITLFPTAVSAILGAAAGAVLSLLSPAMLGWIGERNPGMLDYYVTSFLPVVPVHLLLLMIVLLLLVSFISLSFLLRRRALSFLRSPEQL